ncbi:Periplasmic dipeptide transport protein precursor [Marinovum algicola]|uniref:Peptide/nickel transport system substrate-binding protein n=1 Tax=Marinovum algicola TaxID=42444 RepID=A0A975WA37_9RHOB|nr:peptide/nickel transport system substrate-binding protein [Marinovum algicola]SLN34077.1 Periplasmic dipeptide transport protein precursor [Marinovum algicola]
MLILHLTWSKHLKLLSALAAASIGLAATFGMSAAKAESRPDIVVAVPDLPPTLEPAKELSNIGTRITYDIFDTVIRRDFLSAEDGSGAELTPALAESWAWTDPRTLVLDLRAGVKFHNGETLTAEDVAFTFSAERLSGPESIMANGRGYFGNIESVDATGPLQVTFSLKVADPIFEQRLASWTAWVVNKKDWQANAGDSYPQFPVGTGPFMLDDYKADQSIRLVAFDDYFGGTPKAASVTFVKVPEEAARIAGLVAGDFDIVTTIGPDQIGQINAYDTVEARSVVLSNSHVLVYNTEHPTLADKRIRQAMNLAIDRELLVKALWAGKTVVPLSHQYPEYGALFDPSRDGLVYDPERARALLAEAGYDGAPIHYNTNPNYYVNTVPAAQAIIEMWKAVGLNGKLNLVEDTRGGPEDTLMVRTWSNTTRFPDPAGGLWNLWGPHQSTQRNKEWVPAAFNALGETLDKTPEPAARKEVFHQMLDIWEDEAPGTILYQPLETYGVRKSLKWQPYSHFYLDLRNDNFEDMAVSQ